MNEDVMRGFYYEMEKQGFVKYLRVGAKKMLPSSVRRGAKTFKKGFKASIPFSVGFYGVEQAMKPQHVSLDTPEEKTKRLGKRVATWGIGGGIWDVLSKSMKKNPYKKVAPVAKPAKGILGKAGRFAKKFPGKAGKFGLVLGGTIAAEELARRALFGKEKPPKEIPLTPQPGMKKTSSALQPKKFQQNLTKGQSVKAPKPKKIKPDKIQMSKGTMKNVSSRTKDILKKVKTR